MYPAGIAGVTARRVTVSGGLVLRVLESGQGNPNGDVLLVHGFGSSVYSFCEMIPALAAAGFHVFALDLPGHGLSDKPVADESYTTRALGDAILAAADALGVTACTLVGHSMGGALALDLALRRAPIVRGLVLISSAGIGWAPSIALVKPFSPRLMNRVAPALLTRPVVHGILKVAFATPGRPSPRDVDEYWAPTQFDAFAAACRACIRRVTWKRVSPSRLRQVVVPVLVLAGGHDRVIRGAVSRARHIPGARVVSLSDGGHVVMQECSARVNEEVIRFLREFPAEPGRAGASDYIPSQ